MFSTKWSLLLNFCILVFQLYISIKALAPTIITDPIDTYAAAPFSGVFTCSAKGCGKVNIIWHRQSNSLPQKHILLL